MEKIKKVESREYIERFASAELKVKIETGPYLLKLVFENALRRINEFFEKRGKVYSLEAYVWRDMETPQWEENIISVRTLYGDHTERIKLWQSIENIVRGEIKNQAKHSGESQIIEDINECIATEICSLEE